MPPQRAEPVSTTLGEFATSSTGAAVPGCLPRRQSVPFSKKRHIRARAAACSIERSACPVRQPNADVLLRARSAGSIRLTSDFHPFRNDGVGTNVTPKTHPDFIRNERRASLDAPQVVCDRGLVAGVCVKWTFGRFSMPPLPSLWSNRLGRTSCSGFSTRKKHFPFPLLATKPWQKRHPDLRRPSTLQRTPPALPSGASVNGRLHVGRPPHQAQLKPKLLALLVFGASRPHIITIT
ncbi:MAG: NAD-dependent glyceraldehyde-3-phosphate dehydrogenase [uncultured Sphingomonadaceae bacterium]|uniref:NAD-dependent glyceraldehyde-3-phosphate dehydrogenase n=1 Tax=uncultured Sphingomonadaceae bacterium TaxID=169976 RepID=A0A6J4SFE4_9SPHN|nr:MAG: NAD-dependent glyceraldehyde-3-phosphate dehydrogenase [uncultured Sphingomonadaceae bacterium]